MLINGDIIISSPRNYCIWHTCGWFFSAKLEIKCVTVCMFSNFISTHFVWKFCLFYQPQHTTLHSKKITFLIIGLFKNVNKQNEQKSRVHKEIGIENIISWHWILFEHCTLVMFSFCLLSTGMWLHLCTSLEQEFKFNWLNSAIEKIHTPKI